MLHLRSHRGGLHAQAVHLERAALKDRVKNAGDCADGSAADRPISSCDACLLDEEGFWRILKRSPGPGGPQSLSIALDVAVGFPKLHDCQLVNEAERPIKLGLNQPFTRSRYKARFTIELRRRHAGVKLPEFLELALDNQSAVGVYHPPLGVSLHAGAPFKERLGLLVHRLYDKGA